MDKTSQRDQPWRGKAQRQASEHVNNYKAEPQRWVVGHFDGFMNAIRNGSSIQRNAIYLPSSPLCHFPKMLSLSQSVASQDASVVSMQ
jgi:hypothetical protein